MNMPGLDAARSAIGEFRFSEFRLLRELHLSVAPDDGHTTIDVQITLETEARQPPARICMRFHKVHFLQIHELSGEAQILGFDVTDISDRKWESISWQVLDYENSVLGFYARDAEIVAASLIGER